MGTSRKGGPANRTSRANARDAAAEERRHEVALELFAGWTYRAIAKEHGVSIGTISHDVEVIREQWRDRAAASYDAHVTEALARLDVVVEELIRAIRDGDMSVVPALVRLEDRRARLLGLDKPAQFEISGTVQVEDLEAKKARAAAMLEEQVGAMQRALDQATDGEIIAAASNN